MAEKRAIANNHELMLEWDWEKNNELGLQPDTLSIGANKMVWWKCPQGHCYEAKIKNRVQGCGCSYCAGKKVLVGYNDLQTFFPDVANDWDYEKNITLTPTTVTYASSKKVWWKCNGEFETSIVNRTRRGSGCPYCVNQKVLAGFNDLQFKYPELALEWSDRNLIRPTEVTPCSNRKVYWKCALGHEDYLMTIKQRSNRQGCPICAQQSQISFPEQAIYYYLKQIFADALNRYNVEKREIDIFIPSKKIGIEYNGYFSHRQKDEQDIAKKVFFRELGISIYVVKEYKKIEEKCNADFYIHERTSYADLTTLINDIIALLGCNNAIDVDCKRDAISIKNQYVALRKEKSIAVVRPDLISRWDYEKNGSITPEMVTLGTEQQFYWKCKLCNRSYLAWPSRIADGSVCSRHRNLLKKSGNDLASKYPELLEFWDYEKNKENPSEVYGGGEKVVYWKCKKGHSYSKSILKHVRGEGCPICAGKKVLIGFNDLATVAPNIVKSWDYVKNIEVFPTQFTANSNKRVWWKCEQGHEWETKIGDRVKGTGCPVCYKIKKGLRKINVYDAMSLSFIGSYDSIKSVCEHLGLDYTNMNSAISRVCRRKQKTLMKKYVLRNADDDEFIG